MTRAMPRCYVLGREDVASGHGYVDGRAPDPARHVRLRDVPARPGARGVRRDRWARRACGSADRGWEVPLLSDSRVDIPGAHGRRLAADFSDERPGRRAGLSAAPGNVYQ